MVQTFLHRLNRDSLDLHDFLDKSNHGNPTIPKIMVQTFLHRLNRDSLDLHDYLDKFNHGNPIILRITVQILCASMRSWWSN
jgi:heme oxygenase